jgi:hypothetical protein
MATADVAQDHVAEQHSAPKFILLSLLPGAMVVTMTSASVPPPLSAKFITHSSESTEDIHDASR